MSRVTRGFILSAAALLLSCERSPEIDLALGGLADRCAERIGTIRGDTFLLVETGDVMAETDAPLTRRLVRMGRESRTVIATDVLHAVAAESSVLFVDLQGRLRRYEDQKTTTLAEGAIGRPAVLTTGAIVVSVSDTPGESELLMVGPSLPRRTLAPAPGPDDMPTALTDGRVLFVSARTTVASLWIADPADGSARQITNAGLKAGGDRVGFVPTPSGPVELSGTIAKFNGGGAIWRVDLATGSATQLAQRKADWTPN